MKNKKNQNTHSLNTIPSFSFEFLTKQKEFSFAYFKHEKSQEEKTKAALIDKLLFLSSKSWEEIELLGKKLGYEYIPAKEVKINLDHVHAPEEKKFMVFRFNEERNRLIGFKEKECFYIVGFDFDYDAYNHGA